MAKGNPNPSPATRFKPGEAPAGRAKQKGDRDRLSRKYLYELAEHFEANGKDAIEKVYALDPAKYLAAVSGVIPKEIEITRPLDGMDDGQLAQAIELLADVLRSQAPPTPEEEPKVKHVN